MIGQEPLRPRKREREHRTLLGRVVILRKIECTEARSQLILQCDRVGDDTSGREKRDRPNEGLAPRQPGTILRPVEHQRAQDRNAKKNEPILNEG